MCMNASESQCKYRGRIVNCKSKAYNNYTTLGNNLVLCSDVYT